MKLQLDQIEPNQWNPNEVRGDKYTQLVKDMQEHGQREPITVSPYPVFYPGEVDNTDPEHKPYTTPEAWEGFMVICDGEHRVNAAKSLGWKEIDAQILELTEDEALTRFYRMQSTRGDNNPLREAQLFQHYLDQDLTQDEVVEKLNLSSKAYLTDRLYLLQLSPAVTEALTNFPKVIEERIRVKSYNDDEEELLELIEEVCARKPSMRHYRALSTLPKKMQEELLGALLDSIIEGAPISTRQLEQSVKELKERLEKQKRFVDAHMNAVRPDCPVCGKPPVRFMGDEEELFICMNAHPWRYRLTDQEEEEYEAQQEQERLEQQKQEDYELVEENLQDFTEMHSRPPSIEELRKTFYYDSIYSESDSNKIVEEYLKDHPDHGLKTALEVYTETIDELIEQMEDPNTEEIIDYLCKEFSLLRQSATNILEKYLAEHPEIEPETPIPYIEPEEAEEPGDGWKELEADAEERAARSVDEEINQALGIPPIPQTPSIPQEETPRILRFTTTEASPEELRESIKFWLLGKLQDLVSVERVVLAGMNGEGQEVKLQFNPLFYQGHLVYRVDDEEFDLLISDEQYKGLTMVSPYNTAIPEDELQEKKLTIKRFFEKTWDTDLDPWEDEEVIEKPDEATIPVPDHGRDYAEAINQEQSEQPEEEISKDEPCGSLLCPHCGKQSPNPNYCSNCGKPLLPPETPADATTDRDTAHGLSENETKWLNSPIKELRDLAKELTPDETTWLLENETRKGALGLLSKHLESLSPPIEPIEAEDD